MPDAIFCTASPCTAARADGIGLARHLEPIFLRQGWPQAFHDAAAA
jgi:hypothetical protein